MEKKSMYSAQELFNMDIPKERIGIKIVYKNPNGMIGTWATIFDRPIEEIIEHDVIYRFERDPKIEQVSLYFTINDHHLEYDVDLNSLNFKK